MNFFFYDTAVSYILILQLVVVEFVEDNLLQL